MKSLCLLMICICTLAPAARADVVPGLAQGARFDGDKVVRVTLRTADDVRLMQSLSTDPWTCGWSPDAPINEPIQVDFRVTPAAFTTLSQSGIPFTILIDDVQTLIDAERARLSFTARDTNFFSDFKSYDDVNAYLDALVALRPDIASPLTIGTTVQGRAIRGIKLAAPATTQHPAPKPVIVIDACQHAREWIAVTSAMWTADHLVRQYGSDPAATRMLDAFDVVVLPIINADGYAYTWDPNGNRLWRTNIDGVDLNRNWDINFAGVGSSQAPGNETYCGPAAFSEPESRALKSYFDTLPTLAFVLDVHSYAELILEPWGYTPEVAPDQASLHSLSTAIREAMYAPNHTPYGNGPCYTTLYPVSGDCPDWVYAAHGTLALTAELTPASTVFDGFILPPSEIAPTGTELFDGVCAAADWFTQHSLTVSFPDGEPTYFFAHNTTPVRVRFSRGTTSIMPNTTPTMSWRVGRFGSVTTVPLTLDSTDTQGPIYTASPTAGICGSVVQWFYTVQVSDGSFRRVPTGDGLAPFEVPVHAFDCFGPPCPGDFSGDGLKDVNDIFDFLREWFAKNPDADVDASGAINVADIFAFLRTWFTACP